LITKDSNSKIQGQDTELSKALEAENIKFKAITDGQKNIKDATEEHERQLLAIKELYAKKGCKFKLMLFKPYWTSRMYCQNQKISADKERRLRMI
jgi:hypothetical protein